jgi:hypothetical protein
LEYGYLCWLFEGGYAARGFGGQEVNVYPDNDLITVIQATPTSSSKLYGDVSKEIFNVESPR